MIATVRSATILGARGHPVSVEVHVAKGIPGFTMLGLPDESCREARDRVRAAIVTCGYTWPDKKITVNLAPPSYRKTGSGLDLAIAVGLLVAFEVIPFDAVRDAGLRRRARARRHRSAGCPAWRRWSASTPTTTGSCRPTRVTEARVSGAA